MKEPDSYEKLKNKKKKKKKKIKTMIFPKTTAPSALNHSKKKIN